MGHVHGPEGVDLHGGPRVAFEVGVPEVLVAANDAGVVDQDIDAVHVAQDGGSGVDDRRDVGDVDGVAADLGRTTAEIGDGLLQRRLVHVPQHDGRRLLGDGALGEQPAHPHRRSRDEHPLALDRFHVVSL